MPYSPASALNIKVELQINGTWTTVTSRVRAAGDVEIRHGRGNGAIQGETSKCQLIIGNDDSWLTEGNPMSPWYPYIGRGTPIRVSLTGILGSDARRFSGEIEEMEAVYPGGGSSSMFVLATGTLGVAAQNDDPLSSPLYRSTAGIAPDDFVPDAYWALEDGSDADAFASAKPGGVPGSISGDVTLSSDATLPGSLPLPVFAAGASAAFQVPPHTATGQWVVQFILKVPAFPVPQTVYAQIRTRDSVVARYDMFLDTTTFSPAATVGTNFYDAAGGSLGSRNITIDGGVGVHGIEPSDFADKYVMICVASDTRTVGPYTWLSNVGVDNGLGQGFGALSGGAGFSTSGPGTVESITLVAGTEASFGHTGYFSDPNFDLDATSPNYNANAMYGWTGEQAHERISRLCREEGVTATITGTTSALMGPQRTGTLFELIMDCERADLGLVCDDLSAPGISYRTRADLYNQTAQIAVTQGALTEDLRPSWDNQNVTNDVNLQRTGGSSARATDESHVTRTRRRFKTTPQANLAADSMLSVHAGWRLAIGTAEGPRYAGGGINMRNPDGAKLADAVLGLIPGDRFTAAAAALPAQHPPGGLDQLVIGWQEHLDTDRWLLFPVMVPYGPHLIGVYGTSSTASRWDSADSTLATGYSATATSLSVVTAAGHALWVTKAVYPDRFPFDVEVEGIRLRVTDITSTTSPQTFTVERSVDGYDKALNSGAQLRLWNPARYGL